MKKTSLKKISFILVFAVLLSAFSATSLTASADDETTWGADGREFYTPYTGLMGAFSSEVEVYGLKWNAVQIAQLIFTQGNSILDLSSEFEFRPIDIYYNPVEPTTLWYTPDDSDFISNLPSAAYEFDENDVTICSHYTLGVSAETSYYGHLYLTPRVTSGWGSRYMVMESELGYYVPIYGDSIPIDYETMTSARLCGCLWAW